MKRFTRLCFALSAALVATSCQLTVYEDDFYKVDFYSDYIGVDEDYANKSLDASKAILLGHAYAKKEKLITLSESDSEQSAEYEYYGVNEPTKLEDDANDYYRKSTREAAEGHEWKFDKWVGFYNDGSEVDLSKIKEDCMVFAIFKAVPINYSVSIEGLSSENLYYRCDYGTKLSQNEDYIASPITADPVQFYADPYYQTSALTGLTYMVDDVDLSSTVTAPYYEFISKTEIKGNTKFIFRYADPVNLTFNVKVRAISEDNDIISDWAVQQVTYDYPIVKPVSDDSTEWTFIKSIGEYGDEAKADDPSLSVVDPECIRHNCEITLVYRSKAIKHTIHVYDEDGVTYSAADDITAYEGVPAIFTAPKIYNANKTWTGYYAIKETGEIFDTSTIITSDLNLVPVSVDKEATKLFTVTDANSATPISMEAHYVFNRGFGGYALESISEHFANPGDPALLNGASILSIDADDIDFTTTDNFISMPFGTVALQSLGTSSVVQTIYSISLPASVTRVLGASFRGLTNVETIDLRMNTNLTSVGDFAFDRLASIEDIYLPSSVTSIGHRIVNECRNLADGHLHINKTEASVNALIDAGDITLDWNAISDTESVDVDFQA